MILAGKTEQFLKKSYPYKSDRDRLGIETGPRSERPGTYRLSHATNFNETYFKFCLVLFTSGIAVKTVGFLMHRILYRIAPLTW